MRFTSKYSFKLLSSAVDGIAEFSLNVPLPLLTLATFQVLSKPGVKDLHTIGMIYEC